MSEQTEVIVIGGGMAGAGAAFEISRTSKVVLLERESHCGYHTTGRSAASFTENYGNGVIRRIVLASRAFLTEPPTGFCDYPLLSKRGMITVARADQLDLLREDLEAAQALVPSIVAMTPAEAITRVPVLREDYLAGAYIEPHSMDIDVNGLHQGFLRGARARGARIVTKAGVRGIGRQGGQWRVETEAGTFLAPLIVNAAGAWGDEIAAMAGVRPVGLQPKRRTAFNIPAPASLDISDWPLVNDIGAEFYFKPDAGQLFVSPADATSSEPVDAFAEDIDVAIGAERLERATTIEVQRVSRSWAGLRTFVADGSPVVGPDDEFPDFVWLVGQGGYGIKTSPALSRVCASLIADDGLPDDVARQGVSLAELTPHRLRGAQARLAAS
ncbi:MULTISPECIES: FAD-binding oxidoreductase [unclassified Mesorhizobium]|uniref:NAD(P)/FAD-dependent oxidoreductase n=1 Tax=unclassified Mesorhizobium TaxID=325217 RepID=UPI00112EE94C|nr:MULTISPECIES: FAD-binding oxidoreductase [unclassified Mesorhizobium]TPL00635.1 FAD-binding oxidoreductase [Mesorhizobium sp. B2-4-16]TPL63624.1 FAD-binding oxidoreductase [Mesorhizobium sp. B2-4-3]